MSIFYCTCGDSLGNYTNDRDGGNAITQHQRSHPAGIKKQEPKVVPQPPEESKPVQRTWLGRPLRRK